MKVHIRKGIRLSGERERASKYMFLMSVVTENWRLLAQMNSFRSCSVTKQLGAYGQVTVPCQASVFSSEKYFSCDPLPRVG